LVLAIASYSLLLGGCWELEMRALLTMTILAAAAIAAPAMAAQELYVGEPVVKDGLQIVPNYLTGVEMSEPPLGMEMGPGTIHLEPDVYAAKDEPHGLAEDTWIPYLVIHYDLTKPSSLFHKSGALAAVTAKDGPHYANGVTMDGPGAYLLTSVVSPPALYRHVDKATGTPPWWPPIRAEWTVKYPSQTK
jgi:uncharacterized protein involved in high-affinity Fe2+ transport